MTLLPVLLLVRSFTGPRLISLAITGVILAVSFVGIAGSTAVLAPFGVMAILIETRDSPRRSTPAVWNVAVVSAVFVLTFVALIVASASVYQSR